MLEVTEKTLSKYELDPHLTEEEVLLAAAPLGEADASKTVPLVIPLMALMIAMIGILLSTSSGEAAAALLGAAGAGIILVFRALARVHLAGVAAVIESRRDQGTLNRVPSSTTAPPPTPAATMSRWAPL